MQAIPQLIFNELAQRRRVVLPGLGTLYTEQEPVHWTAATDTLSVPRTHVVFTPTEADGTIIDLISSLSNIPIKDVRPQYHAWLAEVKRTSGPDWIQIDEVGVLFRYPNGSYRVEPSVALDRLLNPVKMSSIHLPELRSVRRGAKPGARRVRPTSGRRRGAGRLWWILLLLVVLLGGGYYAYTHGWFEKGFRQGREWIEQDVGRVGPVLPEGEAVTPPAAPEQAVPLPDTTVGPPVVEPAKALCHVIIGTFASRTNAERLAAKEGPQAMVLPTADGRYMVSAGQYATRQEAEQAKREAADRFYDAWVFEP